MCEAGVTSRIAGNDGQDGTTGDFDASTLADAEPDPSTGRHEIRETRRLDPT